MLATCINHSRASGVALALLVLVLCLNGTVPATAGQPAAADYAAMALRADAFSVIDSYIEARMHELRIPGLALAVVEGDQIVHLKGFGVAGSDGRPVTPQTPFQINSLGKPMTGVAVMQLVENGKLDLDAPVQRYLPWFRVADEAASAQITLRHLLYHTSGLPTEAGIEHALRGDERPDALEAQVRELRVVQLSHPVGQAYEYSNAGYMVLGLIIQVVSGQPYDAYMHKHVFAPLHMRQTFTDWEEARAHGATSGHRYWFGVPVAGDLPINRANLPDGAHTSASAEDVAHFLIAQLNGGRFGTSAVLSPAGVAEMQRPALPRSDGPGFRPMGWELVSTIGDTPTIVMSGASVSYSSMMLLFPERQMGLVVLINANKGLDSTLGDQRLPMLPYNVAEMVLGQTPTVFSADPKPPVFYAILLLAVAAQVAGMARTAILLRRWRIKEHVPSQGAATLVTRLGLPLLCNLGWGLVVLLGIPAVFRAPLSHIAFMAPDFGYTLLASGVVALAWGVARTALMWRLVLRTSARRIAMAALKAEQA